MTSNNQMADVDPVNKSKNRGLTICHANINSIQSGSNDITLRANSKLDEIRLCSELNFDIICLTETWLNKSIRDASIAIKGYSLERKDRLLRRGGGMVWRCITKRTSQ